MSITSKGKPWAHPSGWRTQHCGHPTANWPYYILSPAGDVVVSFNGLGFKTARIARYVAELLAAGQIEATHQGGNCLTVPLTALGQKPVK